MAAQDPSLAHLSQLVGARIAGWFPCGNVLYLVLEPPDGDVAGLRATPYRAPDGSSQLNVERMDERQMRRQLAAAQQVHREAEAVLARAAEALGDPAEPASKAVDIRPRRR